MRLDVAVSVASIVALVVLVIVGLSSGYAIGPIHLH